MPILRKFASPPKISNKKIGAAGPGIGNLFAWGRGAYGSLRPVSPVSSPAQIDTVSTWATPSIGPYVALCTRTDGSLWSWGQNSKGCLGLGDTTNRTSGPVQIGALTNWSKPAAGGTRVAATTYGQHMLCIKTDGTLWAWGNSTIIGNLNPVGTGGVYTLPNARDKSSPVQVGSDQWSEIWTSGYASIGIKTAGTLWGTGYGRAVANQQFYNQNGKVFGPIGVDSNWSKAVTASWGVSTMVKTNGTLWTMGNGTRGQLGHGNTQYYTSPKQVGALTNWAQPLFFGMARSSEVYANGCIKTDGTLWTWGGNAGGQLGHGDTIQRSSPVQVGSDTNWKFVAMAGDAVSASGWCIGVKTNGKLYGWGMNNYGQLGLGDKDNRSSPVQIGTLTNWVRPAAAMRLSFCTTT